MLTFCYDYEIYASNRGMYFDIREALQDDNKNEDELIEKIKHLDYVKAAAITRSFQEKYVTAYGNAAEESLNLIYEGINKMISC